MNIADAITRHAHDRPWAVAVIDGNLVVHYRTLDAAIDRAAAWFQSVGIRDGDMVGLSMTGSALHLVAVYALGRIGAIQIDVPLMNSASSRQALVGRFKILTIVGTAPDLHDVTVIAPQIRWLDPAPAPPPVKIRPGLPDPGFRINLSSGTTGSPKAVLLTHAQYITLFERERAFFPLHESDRYLAVVDLEFVSGLRRCLEILNVGATVVLAPRLVDPGPICALVDRFAITILMLPIGTAANLLSFVPAGAVRWPALRMLRIGSSVIPETTREAVLERLTPRSVISYGTNHIGNVAFADAALQRKHPDVVGCPAKGVEIEIVDNNHQPLPQGEVGQVRVRGEGFPTAYFDDAEATARDFRDGWYYPGDLGMLTDDNALLFRGRSDDVINFDGVKIYPGEIEQALLAHPDVAEAVAFALPSGRFLQAPAAAVRLHRPTDLPRLLDFCRQQLGGRAPENIFVMTAIPKNAMGKVQRRELAQAIGEQTSQAYPAHTR